MASTTAEMPHGEKDRRDESIDREIESLSEAIQVGNNQDDPPSPPQPSDLEKTATHISSSAEHQQAARVKTAQDWNGPDDRDNPQNWSGSKKAGHFLPMAFLAFAVTTGSWIVSPANQDLQEEFGVSRTAAIVPLTVFVVGLGLGPMIAAPLSEQYGRSIVYKISGLAYILFLVGAGVSKTFAGVVICRLLAGPAGAPVIAVGAGTNADMFALQDRAAPSAVYVSAPFLGPAFGPIIGGFAAQFRGWQWTVWCNLILAGAAFLSVLPMHETYKKVILQKRAKKHNLAPPPGPTVASWKYWKALFTTTLIRPVHMLCFEPIVLLFALFNTFTFCIMFAFFPAYPYTFGIVYGFNTWQSGMAFTGIGLGVLCSCVTIILVDRFIYQKKYVEAVQQGKTSGLPEHRLYAGMMGAIGLPIGLFWFAWSARSDVHWISPVLAGIPFAWGNLCLFLSAAMYQIDVYGPLNGASAMAANGLLRYIAGGCFPLWTVQMYEAMGIAWATSLLGFVCVLMLPIPFIFFRYGPQIRARSRYPISRD